MGKASRYENSLGVWKFRLDAFLSVRMNEWMNEWKKEREYQDTTSFTLFRKVEFLLSYDFHIPSVYQQTDNEQIDSIWETATKQKKIRVNKVGGGGRGKKPFWWNVVDRLTRPVQLVEQRIS